MPTPIAPAAATIGGLYWSGLGVVREVTDAAESTATLYSLLVGQSANGTILSSTDEDWYAIELVAGQTYDFRLLGFGATFLTDPLLSLRNATGTQVASSDDGFTSNSNTHEVDSALTYTATTTGTYYLEANAFSTETGRYLLSATQHHAGGAIFTVDEMAWQLINNGTAFLGSPEGMAFHVGTDRTLTISLSGLNAAGTALATQALAVWTAYTGIAFQAVVGPAEITFNDASSGAFTEQVTSGTQITSATVNIGLDWLASFGTTLGSYAFETYLHEIGHALGLGHAGNYNGSANFGTDNHYQNDSVAWSLMSYIQAENDNFDFGGADDWNTFVGASFRDVYTPMVADLVAIQHLYGSHTTAFTGNTTYGFGANTGVAAIDQAALSGALMAMTVTDSSGTDTLNFANTSAHQTITLRAESLSSVLGGRHNLGIARGVTIENANGGSGNDDLYGNAVGNVLRGNLGLDRLYGYGGDDQLLGGTGNDQLDGGLGADTLLGGAGHDTYLVNATTDRVFETTTTTSGINAGGIDTVRSSVSLNLNAYAGIRFVEHLTLTGSAHTAGTGNALNNQLTGNSGNNTLMGGAGNDTLAGGAGNDRLTGGTLSHDRFVFQNAWGVDVVTDFEVASATEVIDLSAISAITSFADLTANHLSTVAGRAVITSGAHTITLIGVSTTSLTAGDFLF